MYSRSVNGSSNQTVSETTLKVELREQVQQLEAKLEQARDEIIEAWHQGAYGERQLWDCLGMTEEEYDLYVALEPKGLKQEPASQDHRDLSLHPTHAPPSAAHAQFHTPENPLNQPGSIWYSDYLQATFAVIGSVEQDPELVTCREVDRQTWEVIAGTEPYLFPEYEFGKRLQLVSVASERQSHE